VVHRVNQQLFDREWTVKASANCVDKNIVRLSFLIIVSFLSTWGVTRPAFAAEGVIFQPIYRLKLSDKEESPYRDYIVSVGTRQGVQVGDVLDVVRAVSASNDLWGGVSPLLEVTMGEVRVMATSPSGSIVRMVKQNSFESIPVMQYARFMVGDSVRTKISFAKPE
jgi:hypothetical protein